MRYVVLGEAQAIAIALWIVHTHVIKAADATPYLAITSAEKRSGKSRLLDVLGLLVARPWRTITPTEAVTFRKIERDEPTLLLDEVDAIFGPKAREHEGLRALLNAGNQRGTQVPRCVGPTQNLVDFRVFCAKALAGIGRLPDTVADRSIEIRLARKAPGERVERFRRHEVEPAAGELRERIEAWSEAEADHLRAARPCLPPELDDRAADGWEPLLAIADAVGAEWPERARLTALTLSIGHETEDDSLGVRLLRDCRRAFDEQGAERLATSSLIAALAADKEAPWQDWRDRGAMSPRALGELLRRYGIQSRSIRLGPHETPKGYLREQFEDTWSRYLAPVPPSPSATPPQPALEGRLTALRIRHSSPAVADRETDGIPHRSCDVADVGVRNPAEVERPVPQDESAP